jgi:myo-inositol-1(or 4)-monophosphatase
MSKLEVMQNIAAEAGRFIIQAKDQTSSQNKANANDFVTVADIKAQDLIRKKLLTEFPNELVVSEEDSEAIRQQLKVKGFTGFVIDPIDGTYNFKRNMRESAISIGYIENGKPTHGVIADPYRDEIYSAQKGKGATCNGTSICVSEQKELSGSSVATSNGYDFSAAARNLQRQIEIFEQTDIMPWTSCPGSAVLTLAWVACGRVDAVHHTGFKPFDTAAAFVILKESGAKLVTLDGKKPLFTDSKLRVGTPAIVTKLQQVFEKLSPSLLT